MQLWMCEDASNHSGGNGKRDPPVLIPNTEVKPLRAECTWLDTARETMAPPDTKKEGLGFESFFLCFREIPLGRAESDVLGARRLSYLKTNCIYARFSV